MLLAPTAFIVGALIGAVGIGGVLLIPALSAFAGLGIHEAMATALFTFIFTGITGTVLFQRRGSIDWRITAPVCAGAVLCAFLGAWMNSLTRPLMLALILAGIIIFAGVYTLATWRGMQQPALHDRPQAQQGLLLGIGAAAGFGSGLTGVGGPALSVPMMVLFGFPALAAIGTSQVIQIIAAASGTLGNLQFGTINFGIAGVVTVLEIAGVFLGARIVHAVNADSLRKFVTVLCIVVGIYLIARALGWF
ncbi:MAG: sulfite exporter TauE/SafE family protein [Burkholderiales bacterium]|nr:sulfite exporter TauE/SafE family protein [Burkholderiales bacterium]